MKNISSYIAGVITGVILTILISFFSEKSSENGITTESGDYTSNNGVTMFAEPGDCISKKQFKVFQVIEPGVALVSEESDRIGATILYNGMVVLFVNDDGKHYYDDERIKIFAGKCARQMGV